MKKHGILIFVIIFIFNICLPSYAAEYESIADSLNLLGLFKGTENGYELDKTLTRAEAVTMITRLMGMETAAQNRGYAAVFQDVPESHWGFKYVMYCYNNSITKGISVNEFNPDANISGQEFTTLLLRTLGYKNTVPESAYSDAAEYGLASSGYIRELSIKDDFIRDDAVYLSYRALKTSTKEGAALSENLIEKGVFTRADAQTAKIVATEPQGMSDIINDLFY